MDNFYPVLCGGTFLTLLIRARKQRLSARDLYKTGAADKLSDRRMFLELIKTVKVNYIEPAGFGKITSEYKNCKKQSTEHLSFLKDFGSQLEAMYQASLDRMVSFIEKYLDVDPDGGLHNRLVRELLDLIEQDRDIGNEDEFRLLPDGLPAKKADLCGTLSEPLDICLPVFLLSVWHFIIRNIPDTTVGRATCESWDASYTIGEDFKRPLNISIELPVDSGIKTEKGLVPQSEPTVDDLIENELPNDGEIYHVILKKTIPSGSRFQKGFVVNKDSYAETQEVDDGEIIAIINGEVSQATKDSMRNTVDDKILPELREKLREPMLHIYDLIIKQANGKDEDVSSKLKSFIHYIDSEILNGSASRMMCLSEHGIYDSLLNLKGFVEEHSRNTSLLSDFGSICCGPSYYTQLLKEFQSLVMEIFSEDDDV